MEGRNIPSSSVTPHLTDYDSQSANMCRPIWQNMFHKCKESTPTQWPHRPTPQEVRDQSKVQLAANKKHKNSSQNFLYLSTGVFLELFVHLYIITEPQGAVQLDEANVKVLKNSVFIIIIKPMITGSIGQGTKKEYIRKHCHVQLGWISWEKASNHQH